MLLNKNDILLGDLTPETAVSANEIICIDASDIEFEKVFPAIEKGKDYHFMTNGSWSNISLLEFLLQYTGKAFVYITSWSISDYAIKRIIDLKDTDKISGAKCVFDKRTASFNPNISDFAKNNVDVQLGSIHAKNMVLIGEKLQLCVVQSANLNENKRIESGVISTQLNAVRFHKNWINILHESLKHAVE